MGEEVKPFVTETVDRLEHRRIAIRHGYKGYQSTQVRLEPDNKTIFLGFKGLEDMADADFTVEEFHNLVREAVLKKRQEPTQC